MASAYNLTLQLNLRGPANLKPVVGNLRKQLQSVSNNTSLNIQINKKSLQSIDAATSKLRVMSRVLREASISSKSLNLTMSKLNKSLGSSKGSANAAARGLKDVADSASKAKKQIQAANNSAVAFGKSLRGQVAKYVGFTAVNTAFSLTTRLLDEAVRAYLDFDRQLIRIQQVTNSTRGAISGLNEEIRRLSISLGASSSELVQVSVTLAQTGLSAREVQSAIKSIAQASLAPTFTDMRQTAEGAIAAFNQFGLAATQLETVLDSINAVASRFAVEADDIIGAIQRTGGVFAAASKGVSEGTDALNQFIAVFTSVRSTTRESSETIATGLKTIFTRLQRLDTITSLQDILGISLLNQGQFVGAYEAIERISEAIERLGLSSRDVRFSQIVEQLGGVRQVGKVIPLLQEFAKAQEAYNVAQSSTGSTSKDAEKAQQSIAVQLIRTREAWDSLVASFADNSVLKFLTKTFLTLTRSLFGFLKSFAPFAPILALIAGAKIGKFIGGVAKGFSQGSKQAGGAGGLGEKFGQTITGAESASDKAKVSAQVKAVEALTDNTKALSSLASSVNNLVNKLDALKPGGGRILPFASGGVVPGTGNRDTVPAMLTPGEFVIRKNAVKALGTEKLHAMNKYAQGGNILQEDAVGIAAIYDEYITRDSGKKILNKRGEIDREQISADIIVKEYYGEKLPTSKPKEKNKQARYDNALDLQGQLNGKSYDYIGQPLSSISYNGKNLGDGIRDTFNKNIIKSVDQTVNSVQSELKIPIVKLNPATTDTFIKGLNEGVLGNLFEQVLSSVANLGTFTDPANPQAPFDFTSGLGGSLGNIYKALKGVNYVDAKANLAAGRKEVAAKKIANQILAIGTTGPGDPDEIRNLIGKTPPATPGTTTSNSLLDKLRKANKTEFTAAAIGLNESIAKVNAANELIARGVLVKKEKEEKKGVVKEYYAFNDPDKKSLGGFIQKFAEGGQAESLVNQIQEMSAIDAIDFYTNKSRRLNTYYDKGKESELNNTYKAAAKTLDQLFNDDIPGTVYAGFGASRTNRLLGNPDNIMDLENVIGNKVTFPAYFSTSEYRDVASDFAQRGGGLNSISDIRTKGKGIDVEAAFERAGAEGRSIERWNTGEYEYILPRGSSFRIDNAENPDGGQSLQFDLTQLAKGGMIQRFAEGGEPKKNKEFGKMMLRMDGNEGRSYYSPNDTRTGFVQFKKWKNNLWTVGLSKATKGYGPKLYDVAMEAVTEAGGMLTSDRALVSKDAQNVWQYYFKNRGDVKKTPLDPTEWTGNYALVDPKLHGKKETWPPATDPAWVLQSGYSKQPSLIKDEETVTRTKGQSGISSAAVALSYFSRYANGGAAEDTVPALLTPGEFVINKKAAARIGSANLHKMNRADKIQGFNKGGPVGFVQRFEEGGVAESLPGARTPMSPMEYRLNLPDTIEVDMDAEPIVEAVEIKLEEVVIDAKQAAEKIQAKMQQTASINAEKFGRVGKGLNQFGFGRKILASKGATKLGGVSDFFAGKGTSAISKSIGSLTKLLGKFPGGLNAVGLALGTGLQFAQDNLLTEEQKRDPTTRAGFAGAKGGVSGAMAGFALGGPIGAVIGGVIGGLKAFKDELERARVDESLRKISEASISLEKSFEELDAGVAGAAARVNKDAGDIIANQKVLDEASSAGTFGENFSKNIVGSILTLGILPYLQSNAGAETAREGLLAQASTLQGAAERKGIYDIGKASEDELAASSGSIIQNQYAQFIAAAEGGLDKVSAGRRAEIEAIAASRAALDAYRLKRKQEGADAQTIAKEIDQNRQKAIAAGNAELDRRNELIKKQAIQARAIKEVSLAVAAQTDVYARLAANLQRAAEATDFLINRVDEFANMSQGSTVDRRNEQVVGNLLAYNPQEIQAAVAPIASALGGTEEANNLAANARVAQVLQSDLPARLRGAQTREDRLAIIDDLRAQFSNLGINTTASDAILKDIARTIEENQDVGTLLEEIDNNIIGQFSNVVQQGQAALQNAVRAYNDNLQKLIDQQNKYNQALARAREYITKAGVIRLDAENKLAEALGQNVSLEKLNASIDLQTRSLTSGLVDRGALTQEEATDPTAIGQGIKQLRESNEALIRKNEEIRQVQAELGTDDKSQAKSRALDEEYRANMEAIAANNQALSDSKTALENLANSTAKADNALKKLQDSQREVAQGADFLQKVLTNTPQDNFEMTRQMGAFQALMNGDQGVAMNPMGRRDAFAGLEIYRSLGLSDAEYNSARADVLEAQLAAQGVDTSQQITVGQNQFTIDELLERMRNPEDSPEVKAYKEAVQEQIDANMMLADLEYQNAEMIAQTIESLENYFRTEFPNALKDALSGAEEAGQRPRASGAELKRRAEAELQAAESDLASLREREQGLKDRKARGFSSNAEREQFGRDVRKYNTDLRNARERQARAQTDIGVATSIERADQVERDRQSREARVEAERLRREGRQERAGVGASYRDQRRAGMSSSDIVGEQRRRAMDTAGGATTNQNPPATPPVGDTDEVATTARRRGRRMTADEMEELMIARGVDTSQQITIGENSFTIDETLDRMRAREGGSTNSEPVAVSGPSLDAVAQMAMQATQPGSIYTHDIHSVEILKQILSVLSNGQGVQGVANGVVERQASNAAVAQTSLSEDSLNRLAQFNENFATYVDKLVNFNFPTIPETIQLNANHVVEVRFTGAAALNQLEDSIKNLAMEETNNAMNEIWGQSNGSLGRRPNFMA
jgi:TP901 family phage tail tape measure protein